MPVLAWGLLALLALLLLVLLTPWHVRLAGRTTPLEGRVEVRFLGGYAPAVRLPLGRSPDREPKLKKPRQTTGKKRKRSMPRGIADLVFGLLAAFRVRRLHLAGRFGLDDPADTGTLWGRLSPLVYGLTGPGRRIALAPDFGGPCLDLEGFAEIAIRPTRLLRAGIAFAWANRKRSAA
jgi:hypothetical protein